MAAAPRTLASSTVLRTYRELLECCRRLPAAQGTEAVAQVRAEVRANRELADPVEVQEALRRMVGRISFLKMTTPRRGPSWRDSVSYGAARTSPPTCKCVRHHRRRRRQVSTGGCLKQPAPAMPPLSDRLVPPRRHICRPGRRCRGVSGAEQGLAGGGWQDQHGGSPVVPQPAAKAAAFWA